MTDPYVQPNGVLKNLLGVKDGHKLLAAEGPLTANRIFQLYKSPISGKIDLEHWKAIHHHIFQDVFPFAGEIRTVRIAKDDTEFCHPAFIESTANNVFTKLAHDREGIGNNRDAFVQIAADLHNDLIAIHPYREGNGRSTRLLLDHLAHEHGFAFSWDQITRSELVGASIMGMAGMNGLMRGLLDRITTRTVQHEHTAKPNRHLAFVSPSVEAPRQSRRMR